MVWSVMGYNVVGGRATYGGNPVRIGTVVRIALRFPARCAGLADVGR